MPSPASVPPAASNTEAPAAAWSLRLLGAVEARRGPQELSRWPSRAAAALLARLALWPDRAHPREELVELLWPGVALDVGRNRLRQTLSTLKSLLEAGGGPVIRADRSVIRLVPGSLRCDAVEFELLARQGAMAAALERYGGDLMPGYYDDWVLESRASLSALLERLQAQAGAGADSVGAQPDPAEDTLPATWTRLFGVEHRATRLAVLARESRLVTVVGPGGCGKTRLVIEVARALRVPPDWAPEADANPTRFQRVVYVPLVECFEGTQALNAIAQRLQAGAPDPLTGITQALQRQTALLVLDNFEQLLATPAVAYLARLLESLPRLHLLVTSRQRLGLAGEQVFAVGGLALPAADAAPAELALNPAVALFLDRMQAERVETGATPQDLAAVRELVCRLDGMPLALELAASRTRSFGPAAMLRVLAADTASPAAESGGQLSLLSRSGPRAGHDPRPASMEQVIDWSWRLVDAPGRRLLAALSCWSDHAGTRALAAMTGEPVAATAARLDDLVGHSLVRVVDPRASRFGLVEPVREFVRAQLPAAETRILRDAMRRWLLDWARGPGGTPAPTRVALELRAIHAVLATAADAPREALALALALRSHWDTDGLPVHVQAALEQALSVLRPADQVLRSDLHELLAYLRFEAGCVAEAAAHAQLALEAAGDDPSRRARALVRQAWVRIAAGRSADVVGAPLDPLRGKLLEALGLARAAGDREAQARALHQMAALLTQQGGDHAVAEELLAQSQQLWLALGDRRKANARLRNRAQCWVVIGRLDDALLTFRQCERAARDDGDWVGQIDSQLSLSSLLAARRQWAEALEIDRRCVTLCWQRWHRHGLGYALWNPPRLLARLRRPEAAMRLMAFAANFWQTQFGALSRHDQRTVKLVQRLVRAQLGPARAEGLWIEGATMDIAAAVALAQQG